LGGSFYFVKRNSVHPEYYLKLKEVKAVLLKMRREGMSHGLVNDKVLEQEKYYSKLFAENFPYSSRYQIHILAVSGGGLNPANLKNRLRSETVIEKAKQYLESVRPDVIAEEPYTGEQVTVQTRSQDVANIFRLLSSPTQDLGEIMKTEVPRTGASLYQQAHPEAIIIGTEEPYLCALNLEMRMLVSRNKAYADLHSKTFWLRSEVALAYLIAKLKATGGKVGAMEMRAGHELDLVELQPLLGFSLIVYKDNPDQE